MKYFVLFAICLCGTGVICAVNANDSNNGEVVMYNVNACSDDGFKWGGAWSGSLMDKVWAYANVSAESGSVGYFSIWAEAGADRGKRDSGGYLSGSSSFSKEVRAEDYVYMGGDYTSHSAYINSQDDEDW